MALAFITGTYLGLIGAPAFVALLIASPTLLAWKKHKHRLFKRVFETIFVFLYILWVLAMLVSQLITTKSPAS